MSAPTVERVWDAERRARELVTRRDELVRRLPREIRAAGRLTEDVRELIVDDSIEFAALRYEYPVTCTHELERAFWDACAKRTRRGLERRYDTVRGQFTRADEHAIDTLVGDHDPVAELERAQERALAREFAATLEPHERRVLVCKYDTDGSEPAGYKVIARRLGLGVGRVRSAERSIERKIERFAAVYAAGRLCDLRETAVTALAAGTADPRQATTALAHVKHCGHCRPFYAQQLRELGSDAFAPQGRLAAAGRRAPTARTTTRNVGRLRRHARRGRSRTRAPPPRRSSRAAARAAASARSPR